MTRKPILALGLVALAAMMFVPPVHANVSGALFTTVADGSEVNFNIYQAKTDVYLNGGPGPGAPEGAAGLPDGDYVFMVTDPPGKNLLSTDIAACREFMVSRGDIVALVTSGGCATPHVTNVLSDGAITVQLYPFNDTPNKGNEYKVWATPVSDYKCALTVVSCGSGTFGFIHSDSKTDNFKVKISGVVEIDTRFIDNNGNFIDGLGITWIDTLGASNNKWSYLNVALDINHEAHVEAPEDGTHVIVVGNQPGCTAGVIYLNGDALPNTGPQTVSVRVLPSYKNMTLRVDVYCQ